MEEKSLIHIIPSNKWGGVQAYALDICRHYKEAGWKVTALTRNALGVDSRFAEEGIELRHAPLGGFFDIPSILTLRQILRKTAPGSVVHAHRYRDAFSAIIARKLANRRDIRIVTTRHTVRRGQNTRLFKKIYDKVDAHIFVSGMAYTGFRQSIAGTINLDSKKVHILHNSLLLPAESYKEPPSQGPVCALYQGAIVKGKGLEVLIDAMALLKDIKLRLRIAGSGNPDYLDMLRRRAIQRDVMNSIDWNIKPVAGIELCLDSHFGVVPSTEREAFSLESLRFMAAGRAQVATANGAQREYLSDGETAILIEPGDAPQLAAAMRQLATDKDLRHRMGLMACGEFNSHLSWQQFINTLDKIYTK